MTTLLKSVCIYIYIYIFFFLVEKNIYGPGLILNKIMEKTKLLRCA